MTTQTGGTGPTIALVHGAWADASGFATAGPARPRFRATGFAKPPRVTSDVMAATQRPWSGAGFYEPSGPPAWRTIPSGYLLCTEDQASPPAAQRFMAERASARIREVAASHASIVSQPEAATQIILEAAGAAAPARA
jgi:hypothetical protein